MIDHIFDMMAKVISVASVITATTPTPSPKTFLGKVYKFIEYFALVNNKVKMSYEQDKK